MKKIYKAYIIFGALGLWSCGHNGTAAPDAHDHREHADGEIDHEGEDLHDHGHAHGAGAAEEIILEPEVAAMYGVEVDTISAEAFCEVIRVTGQILDTPGSASVVSAPTAGIVKYVAGMQPGKSIGAGATIATISSAGISGGDRNYIDRKAMESAKRELDRLRPLHEEGIVSTKDYNAALQAYELAKAQYSPAAASGSARTVSGGVISQILVPNGQYVEAGTPIATVSANQRLTLRADVPERYRSQIPTVTNARIKLPYTEGVVDIKELGGTKVSGAQATIREMPGYMPLYFSFDNNGVTQTNTLVDVYLIGAPRYGVMTVPIAAVSEQQGLKFVYVQLDEEGYEKRPVTLGSNDGERVEVVSGLHGDEHVVVKGATAVRLAETSGAVPEGHSHSH